MEILLPRVYLLARTPFSMNPNPSEMTVRLMNVVKG